jgi:hypothetical protein
MIFLYILVGIIVLIAILAFIVPTPFEHKAEVIIDKPKHLVFDYLRYLRNQDEWSVWGKADPNMKTEFIGADGTVGFIERWEGNRKAGKGSQTISRIREDERIDFDFQFEKPFRLRNDVYFSTTTVNESQTKVVRSISGVSPRPFNLMFPLLKSSILRDFNRSLQNLKTVLESK